jgi:hypothetical protein
VDDGETDSVDDREPAAYAKLFVAKLLGDPTLSGGDGDRAGAVALP